MLRRNIKKIVFTGPESSGKTTAASKYAKQSELPLVNEYAREYLDKIGLNYRLSDLHKILEGQYKAEVEAASKNEIIVCDTDWLTIYIWASDKFDKRIPPPFNLSERHYILCPPDIPWQPDPQRENPEDRDRLYTLYLDTLNDMNLSYEILKR